MSDDTYRAAGRPTKAHSIELARALIAQTKAAMCPCGVKPQDCADHDPARQPAPEESQP
jgi:hypothetical protein